MADRRKPALDKRIRELPNFLLSPPANNPLSQQDAEGLAESAILSGASTPGETVIDASNITEILNSFETYINGMKDVAASTFL